MMPAFCEYQARVLIQTELVNFLPRRGAMEQNYASLRSWKVIGDDLSRKGLHKASPRCYHETETEECVVIL